MRAFLPASGPGLAWAITVVHALILLLSIRGYGKSRQPLYLLLAFLSFGLCYDALIQALGTALGEGSALFFLSRFRYVFHGALIPLLFPICAYALNFKRPWRIAAWVLTGVVMVLGIAQGFATVMVPEKMAGILRMASDKEATPAWAGAVSMLLAFGTILPVILAGIWVWIRQKTPLLFLAGFLMFAFAALGPASGNLDLNFLITMFGEVFLGLFFLLYAGHKTKKENSK